MTEHSRVCSGISGVRAKGKVYPYHLQNLQWSLPFVVLFGHVVVWAAHVAPWYLFHDALAQTAGVATRAVTKASWRMLPYSVKRRRFQGCFSEKSDRRLCREGCAMNKKIQ
jgi:hypothetical protein